jgi:hypothetical protein
LTLRVRYPAENRVHEFFDKGRQHDIQEHIFTAGVSRQLLFYPGSRVDGLVSRTVLIGTKVTWIHTTRSDIIDY